MTTMTYTKRFLIISLLILTVSFQAGAQRRCEECSRHGMLAEFLNPHNQDYEQRLKEWNECMRQQLGDREFKEEDSLNPELNDAIDKCQALDPPDKWYCYPSMMSAYMGERFTNPCFHFLSPIFYAPGTDKPPEYIFKGSYEANIEGGGIIEYSDGSKKPVTARMELRLYYNGNSPELIHEWSSENSNNYPRALFNKLKTPKSLNPILEEFEKRPVSIDVEVPTQEEICEKGTGIIVLSGFKDAGGNASREFNRIVVSIYRGKILNGADSDYGPDYKVFNVGEGEVRVEYQPPEDKDDGYEWLRVYNSCDILPKEKHPLSSTAPDELIVDQHFPIFCGFYKGSITVTKTWNYNVVHENYTSAYSGSITMLFNGIFKPKKGTEEMEDQPIRIYEPANVDSQWEYNEDITCQGAGCSCPGLSSQEYGSGTLPELTLTGLMIITNSFPTDNKVVADQLAQFGLQNWYDIITPPDNVPTQTRVKHEIDDNCVWITRETSAYLVGSDIRYTLKDIGHLSGLAEWNSSKGRTTDLSVTNMTEAIYDQKPFDPEEDGSEYHYSIKWDLKAL